MNMPPQSRFGGISELVMREIAKKHARDAFAPTNRLGGSHLDMIDVQNLIRAEEIIFYAIRDALDRVPVTPASEKLPSEDITEAYRRILTLTKALEQCVRVAQMWHGDDAFDIYFNHSPEMKLVRDALGKMPDPTEEA